MLALIAGTGDLPVAIHAALPEKPLVCALDGFVPKLAPDITFRIEHLGSFLADLKARGVSQICLAGAVKRPEIDPTQIDAATMPLVPKVQAAIAKGDDGALRIILSILEDAGFEIVAAHNVVSDLLPSAGVYTDAQPAEWHRADAQVAERCISEMGAADVGQACIARVGRIEAQETQDGTDAMLRAFCAPYAKTDTPADPISWAIDTAGDAIGGVADWLSGADGPGPVTADDGILFKAPKPNQDTRADLPVIGPGTAKLAAEAGLAGIVIEAEGVMVLDQGQIVDILNMNKMFLWVRSRGGQ